MYGSILENQLFLVDTADINQQTKKNTRDHGIHTQLNVLERFSLECRKVIGFAFTTLRDWFKKLAPLFHPIRSKTKTKS